MSEFIFSEKNEEFVRILTILGKGISEKDNYLIEQAKQEYAKYDIQVGFKDETQQIVLVAGDKPYYFNLSSYDGIKEAEIIKE